MEKIKRYCVDWKYSEMEEDSSGSLVEYEDHERVVKELEKEIARLWKFSCEQTVIIQKLEDHNSPHWCK